MTKSLKTTEIILIAHGRFEKDFLEQLANDVSVVFEIPVTVARFHHDIAPYFNAARKQYDANHLLKLLHTDYSMDSVKTLGLFHVDLYIPILTYIFGQAEYKGNAGIASVFRLRNEQYGMPGNDLLLNKRTRKVIIHELGHMFGLIHCHIPVCVMRPGTYVEDIDQKKHTFCNKCRSILDTALPDK